MDYADNDGEFHLEAILNRENVICVEEPSWVESERIYALFAVILIRVWIVLHVNGKAQVLEARKRIAVDGDEVWCSICEAWERINLVARSKPIIRDCEPFIIKKTIVAREKSHQEKHVPESLDIAKGGNVF